jgi:hypothetical protein
MATLDIYLTSGQVITLRGIKDWSFTERAEGPNLKLTRWKFTRQWYVRNMPTFLDPGSIVAVVRR